MDRATLDGPGPDQRHLHHQVVELLRPQPGQGRHLGPRLDLEHPHRVRRLEHPVDAGVLLRDRVQRPAVPVVRLDQVEAVVQGRQHAQAEQVELDQAGVGAVVLVPLQHAAAGHPGPLHRADVAHRPVADDHPAGVDAQVPRQPLQLPGQRGHVIGHARVVAGHLARAGPVGPGVQFLRRVAEGPARVPQRQPRPVRDHVGHLGRPVPAVAVVDVLDRLFPAAVLDVQVDVGRPVPPGGQEALEQQAVPDRVHAGDPQRVADGRVRGRTATLAQDVLVLAEPDDVVDEQEVAGEPELADHGELVLDLAVRPGLPLRFRWPVALRRLFRDQRAQPGHLVVPGGHREVGQLRGQVPEAERAGLGQLHGPLLDAGEPAQPAAHLRPGPEIGGAGRGQPAVHLGQAAPGPDRGQRLGQPGPGGRGVVHVAGGDHADPGRAGQPGQQVVPLVVAGLVVEGQLGEDVARPNMAVSARSSASAAAGPPVARAAGTAPFRQPVSTTQCPSWAWPSASRS